MNPVPTEHEIRKYFNSIHRQPDDKELVYPILEEDGDGVELNQFVSTERDQ